jgi:hypothetical protein
MLKVIQLDSGRRKLLILSVTQSTLYSVSLSVFSAFYIPQ